MRRFLLVAILAASALLLRANPEEAPLTADQIVQKHTEALGGAEKLNAIRTLVATGKASILGQTEAQLMIQVKRPNLMRLEITFRGQKIVQAFDGVTAWTRARAVPFSHSVQRTGDRESIGFAKQ